ncbi:MAG TPA: DUF3105 domain-containing protein [Solirubrobacteraceae bacterium]|nr:DUF3105 domain-containing protein [Solirubrobacteraceae bacterium]
MSSRQEEKEHRRQERLEHEQSEAAARARVRRLQIAFGALLGAVAIAAIVWAITSSDGKKKALSPKAPPPPSLTAAATAAGCVARTVPIEGHSHVPGSVNYRGNPPTSGNHNPTPAADGDYVGKPVPAKEMTVHTLEHGRIEIQYRPGTAASVIGQLEGLFNEQLGNLPSGYHVLLFQNQTNMPFAVAATAWGHYLGCPKFNAKVPAAIRAFRVAYTDKAPEQIP